MKHVVTIARLVLGLVFTLFGANGLMMAFTGQGFIPMPDTPPPADAAAFMGLLAGSKYMLVVKIIETTCGLLLLSGYFVPLALAMLTPVLVNILLYHFNFDMGGVAFPLVLAAVDVFLLWAYRNVFGLFFEPKIAPAELTYSRHPAPVGAK